MDRLTCYFDDETAVVRECCTFDRQSDTEPDDCVSCGEMCEEKDESCSVCPIQKAFNKLAHYEDLEEQGRIMELPCKVGDPIFYILEGEIHEYCVQDISTRFIFFDNGSQYLSNIGKRVFLTREQAEEALKETEEIE